MNYEVKQKPAKRTGLEVYEHPNVYWTNENKTEIHFSTAGIFFSAAKKGRSFKCELQYDYRDPDYLNALDVSRYGTYGIHFDCKTFDEVIETLENKLSESFKMMNNHGYKVEKTSKKTVKQVAKAAFIHFQAFKNDVRPNRDADFVDRMVLNLPESERIEIKNMTEKYINRSNAVMKYQNKLKNAFISKYSSSIFNACVNHYKFSLSTFLKLTNSTIEDVREKNENLIKHMIRHYSI